MDIWLPLQTQNSKDQSQNWQIFAHWGGQISWDSMTRPCLISSNHDIQAIGKIHIACFGFTLYCWERHFVVIVYLYWKLNNKLPLILTFHDSRGSGASGAWLHSPEDLLLYPICSLALSPVPCLDNRHSCTTRLEECHNPNRSRSNFSDCNEQPQIFTREFQVMWDSDLTTKKQGKKPLRSFQVINESYVCWE